MPTTAWAPGDATGNGAMVATTPPTIGLRKKEPEAADREPADGRLEEVGGAVTARLGREEPDDEPDKKPPGRRDGDP